jgi:hypothetical protein
MPKMYLSLAVLSASLLLPFGAAFACPNSLLVLKTRHLPGKMTLCQLQDRYQHALQKMREQGIKNPERVSDLLAPRFINLPDWQRSREKNDYNPRTIYNPAPKTWDGWEAGAKYMQAIESRNSSVGYVTPISLDTIIAVHESALQGLGTPTGKFREGVDVGKALNRQSAIDTAVAENLRDLQFRSFRNPLHKLVSWRTTACLEDRSNEFKAQFAARAAKGNAFDPSEWPEQDPTTYFSSAEGTKKQCGYLKYADPKDVQSQLKTWTFAMNGLIAAINTRSSFFDVLWATARLQRWLISIHPFSDGNGRVSRFMMEYVLRSVGLPTPILNDFDNDLYVSESEWTKEIGRGLVKAVKIAETCAAKPTTKGCNEVP